MSPGESASRNIKMDISHDSILKTENITKRFGGLVAVDNVSMSINNGEIRCIIGPNGAGKSTFAQLVCGTHIADKGKVFLKNRDITKLQAYQRVQLGIGIKFQTNRAFHNLTVSQNLKVPLRNGKKNKKVLAINYFDIALELFKLDRTTDLLAKELAHHQLQWLEICMALATKPDILFLDEPTAGMSPEETYFTSEVVKKLNENGLTIIVVEHDMVFVKEIAQSVTVLHQGRIFAEGSIEEVSSDERVKNIYLGQS